MKIRAKEKELEMPTKIRNIERKANPVKMVTFFPTMSDNIPPRVLLVAKPRDIAKIINPA